MGRPKQLNREIKICSICSGTFEIRTNRAKQQKTCSLKCSYIYRGQNRALLIVYKYCLTCKNVFSTKKRMKEAVYCSVRCSNNSSIRSEKLHMAQYGISETQKTKEKRRILQKAKWADKEFREYMINRIFPGDSRKKGAIASSKTMKVLWKNDYNKYTVLRIQAAIKFNGIRINIAMFDSGRFHAKP